MAYLIVDLVAKNDGKKRRIGATVDAFFRVCCDNSTLVEPTNLYELSEQLAALSAINSHIAVDLIDVVILVCHAGPEGFNLPEGDPATWNALGTLLRQLFPSVTVLILCGCETGTATTLEALLAASPSLSAVYGTLDKIPFEHAAFGILGLIFHITVSDLGVEAAIERVTKDTGVGFARKVRT